MSASTLYLLDKLLRRLPACRLPTYRFFVQALADKARLPAGRGKAYVTRWLTLDDPVLSQLGRPATVIAERFAQGAQCLVATRDGRLAGCIWFVRACYHEDEVRVDFRLPDPQAVWDFDVFVADGERMGFLFARLWDEFDTHLRTARVAYSVSRISAYNAPSLSAHQRLGAQAYGWATFLCVGPMQFMVAS